MRTGILLALATALACGSRTELDVTMSPAQTDGDAGVRVDDAGRRIACTATTTTVLATFSTGDANSLLDQIALDDDYVYVHAVESILRVPKGGGPLQVLVDAYWPGISFPNLGAFALSSTTISYIANDSITQIAKAGGAPVTQLQFPIENVMGLSQVPDGFWVWQGVGDPMHLLHVDPTGKPIGSPLNVDEHIAAKVTDDGTHVWVPMPSGLDVVANGSLSPVAAISLTDLVDDGEALFAVGGVAPQWDTHTRVYRIDKATSAVSVLADDGKVKWGVAIDDANVYFTQYDDGEVARVSKSGGAPTVVGAFQGDTTIGVAVDDTCVYWTVNGLNGPGHIMAAPKK